MASLNNVIRLLNGVIGEYPEDLPRSNLEVIQILRDLKPPNAVLQSHYSRMQMVDDKELEELCCSVAVLLNLASYLAVQLIEWASGKSMLLLGPSGTVIEAIKAIRDAFSKFERLADKQKPKFETRPQLFKDCCFAYLRGCFTYSIIFQSLLYPANDCDHLAFYTEHLECDLESSFKFDTNQDFEYPSWNQDFARHKKTLADCIHFANQIPRGCHLTKQPGKPVCPQFYRNPGPYGPRLLRNENHPANRAYFMRKRARQVGYIMGNTREVRATLTPSVPPN
ncbi:hypothetical protein EYC80_001189 [Monilinia laxa]|uniref:Uncharacterized protein n=1 Tax=Monilinia laxa TaxID=61186 RepID=A0A5N6K8M0_MONLA|nr:hypothetical protein EYC80_001189 [Monilinia laxa]